MKQRSGKPVYGFTLVELMVSVAIVGILASIAVPNYQRYVFRAKAAEVVLWLDPIISSVRAATAQARADGKSYLVYKTRDGDLNICVYEKGRPSCNDDRNAVQTTLFSKSQLLVANKPILIEASSCFRGCNDFSLSLTLHNVTPEERSNWKPLLYEAGEILRPNIAAVQSHGCVPASAPGQCFVYLYF